MEKKSVSFTFLEANLYSMGFQQVVDVIRLMTPSCVERGKVCLISVSFKHLLFFVKFQSCVLLIQQMSRVTDPIHHFRFSCLDFYCFPPFKTVPKNVFPSSSTARAITLCSVVLCHWGRLKCVFTRSFVLCISAKVNDPHSVLFSLFSLSIYVVTWNVSQKYPDNITLNDLLDVDTSLDKSLPDIYIVGLQEVNANPQNIVTNFFKSDPVSWILIECCFFGCDKNRKNLFN